MHVLHRPQLPRLISVSIAAAIVAIVISLALASSMSSVSQPGGAISVAIPQAAPAQGSGLGTNLPRWASDPFARLISRQLPQPWLTARP